MVKALAQLAFTFKGSREADEDNLGRYLSGIAAGEIDFSPTNPLRRAYLMTSGERAEQFPGIERYLTPSIAMQAYAVDDQGQLRFGPASRDISRYLGDLMRWQLDLPSRPALVPLVSRLISDGRLPPETLKIYAPPALDLSEVDL